MTRKMVTRLRDTLARVAGELEKAESKMFRVERLLVKDSDGVVTQAPFNALVCQNHQRGQDLAAAIARAEQAERERDEAKDRAALYSKDTSMVMEQRDALRADLNAARAESDALREQNGMYRSDLRDTRTALTDCTAQNKHMRAELSKWKRIRENTHGSCCQCQACGLDCDECRCDLESLADDVEQMRAELARLGPVEQEAYVHELSDCYGEEKYMWLRAMKDYEAEGFSEPKEVRAIRRVLAPEVQP
jgi:chromosome segregation ATPase